MKKLKVNYTINPAGCDGIAADSTIEVSSDVAAEAARAARQFTARMRYLNIPVSVTIYNIVTEELDGPENTLSQKVKYSELLKGSENSREAFPL